MQMLKSSLMLFFAISVTAIPVEAHDFKIGSITIGHPWTRPAMGMSTPAVAYFTLDNQGSEEDSLIGATSPMATVVTLHRTEVQDGIARMLPQTEPIGIPAHQAVKLEPGGYHLMLSGRTATFMADQLIPLRLNFANAGEIEIMLKVERMAPADHGGHQSMTE